MESAIPLEYLVSDTARRRWLENAVRRFPLRLEMVEIDGADPKILALETEGAVVLRPHGCVVRRYAITGDLKNVSYRQQVMHAEHQGIRYVFMAVPGDEKGPSNL